MNSWTPQTLSGTPSPTAAPRTYHPPLPPVLGDYELPCLPNPPNWNPVLGTLHIAVAVDIGYQDEMRKVSAHGFQAAKKA